MSGFHALTDLIGPDSGLSFQPAPVSECSVRPVYAEELCKRHADLRWATQRPRVPMPVRVHEQPDRRPTDRKPRPETPKEAGLVRIRELRQMVKP